MRCVKINKEYAGISIELTIENNYHFITKVYKIINLTYLLSLIKPFVSFIKSYFCYLHSMLMSAFNYRRSTNISYLCLCRWLLFCFCQNLDLFICVVGDGDVIYSLCVPFYWRLFKAWAFRPMLKESLLFRF